VAVRAPLGVQAHQDRLVEELLLAAWSALLV
jgi:hypothetical protein